LVAGAGLDENATQRNRFVKEINKYHVMLRGLSPFTPSTGFSTPGHSFQDAQGQRTGNTLTTMKQNSVSFVTCFRVFLGIIQFRHFQRNIYYNSANVHT